MIEAILPLTINADSLHWMFHSSIDNNKETRNDSCTADYTLSELQKHDTRLSYITRKQVENLKTTNEIIKWTGGISRCGGKSIARLGGKLWDDKVIYGIVHVLCPKFNSNR